MKYQAESCMVETQSCEILSKILGFVSHRWKDKQKVGYKCELSSDFVSHMSRDTQ